MNIPYHRYLGYAILLSNYLYVCSFLCVINLNTYLYSIDTVYNRVMADTPSTTLDLNKWIDDMSIAMARTTFGMIDKHAGGKGVEVQKSLALAFVTRIVTGVVMATLTHRPEGLKSKRALADYNVNAFSDIKVLTQESIAEAFTIALSEYSGVNTEYYCSLKIVPPAPSKEFQ